jgi:O-acetyl-ADP-ribose deacetylase (regulator of RNase III)
MPFQIVRQDITKMIVDVIVNSADPKPFVGGGIDLAIH